MFEGCCVEDDFRTVPVEEICDCVGVADARQNRCGRRCVLGVKQGLVDLVEGTFGCVEQDDLGCTRVCNCSSQG